jgi:hypothetical protein
MVYILPTCEYFVSTQWMFTTMLTGPRINADDVTPSNGLHLPWRGKKYVQYYATIHGGQNSLVGSINAKKSFTWGGGHQCKVQTSLHSGPMLKINCHIYRNHWPQPFTQTLPLSAPAYLTCDIVLLREDYIGTSGVFFV